MKFVISCILIAMLLVSCDPRLINGYVVDNKSDFLVVVKFKLVDGQRTNNSTDSIQTKLIKSGSTAEIISYGEIGNAHDKKGSFLEAIDTVIVTLNGVDISEKVNERRNWKYKVLNEGLKILDEVEYKLIIQNEDLIKVKQ